MSDNPGNRGLRHGSDSAPRIRCASAHSATPRRPAVGSQAPSARRSREEECARFAESALALLRRRRPLPPSPARSPTKPAAALAGSDCASTQGPVSCPKAVGTCASGVLSLAPLQLDGTSGVGGGAAVPRRWPADSTRAGGARRSSLWASSGRLSAAATGVAAAERRLRPGWRQRTARAGSAQGALRAVARSPLCLAAGWLFAARATAARCRPRVRARARCPWGPRGRARVSSRERGVLQIVTIHLPQNFCARIRAPCTGAVARLLLKQHC